MTLLYDDGEPYEGKYLRGTGIAQAILVELVEGKKKVELIVRMDLDVDTGM